MTDRPEGLPTTGGQGPLGAMPTRIHGGTPSMSAETEKMSSPPLTDCLAARCLAPAPRVAAGRGPRWRGRPPARAPPAPVAAWLTQTGSGKRRRRNNRRRREGARSNFSFILKAKGNWWVILKGHCLMSGHGLGGQVSPAPAKWNMNVFS